MLDRDFNIKLIDFGLAESVWARDHEKRKEILTTGTTGFIAPEQLYNDGSGKFCLMKCDIFALGVFLFILLRGTNPFIEPNKDDPYYQYIISKRYNQFWKSHQTWREGDMISREVKALICDMISFNPDERPDVHSIR